MGRILAFAYGLGAYGLFLVTFLYLVGFLANAWVPKGIDDGVAASTSTALIVNFGLMAVFGLQHSVMARPRFKRWLTGFASPSIERSTFVLFSSLALLLLFWQWRPMTATIWQVGSHWAAVALWTVLALGVGLVLASSFLIDHFDLFGLRQVALPLVRRNYSHLPFQVTSLYRFVRHPLYLGLLLALWGTPHMTLGHLVFALGMSAYVFIGVRFEERDLETFLGDPYRRYRARVPMLLPIHGRAHEAVPPAAQPAAEEH